jgi:hypothetical protein
VKGKSFDLLEESCACLLATCLLWEFLLFLSKVLTFFIIFFPTYTLPDAAATTPAIPNTIVTGLIMFSVILDDSDIFPPGSN